MIYTIDFKAVLGWFIQRWSRELTWIDDVAIPCPLLYLGLYIAAPTPSLGHPKALIHILLIRIRASLKM